MYKAIRKYGLWLWHASKGVRRKLVVNIAVGCLSICLNLAFIWTSKQLVDIATHVVHGSILPFSIILVVLMLLRIAANAYNTRLENLTTAKMSFVIRQKQYSKLLHAQWQGKEKMHSGDTLNRLFTDVDKVTNVICAESTSVVMTLFQLATAFVFLGVMNIRLALFILLITPAMFVFSKVFFKKMRNLTKAIRETESQVQSHIQESIQHKTIVQSLEQSGYMEEQLSNLQNEELSQILKRTRFSIFSKTVVSLAFNIGYIAALLWGVIGISKGTMTFGTLTAFLQLVGQVQGPSLRLLRQIPEFAYVTASIDRLSELEDAPKEEMGDPIKVNGRLGIRLSDVSFMYPDGTENVLEDFNFDFRPGSRTAIVGETGVGKSTTIKLMLSLLRPTSGSIQIYSDNGECVEASPLTRSNLVYVPQGNTLFSGTIRQNLLMGNPMASDEDLYRVLDVAAAEFVRELPDGLNTRCGEQGTGLSEGQAQRIAIARGLLRPGSIMLLDEFSSSLDAQTEERLITNLTRGNEDKTMIFITHREKIADFCDSILRLS